MTARVVIDTRNPGRSPYVPLLDSEKKSPSILVRVLPVTLLPLLQEMQPLGTLLASQAMFHNSSHREGMGRVGKHASLDPDLGYWVRDVPQREQLAKAQTAEQGALHRVSSVSLDSPSSLEPCAPSHGPHPELGCQLYLHLPWQ
ncbi:TBC1 domain family member 3L [Manis javanica]|nr:TBC1 domain family member 3L [Manis javanica]